MNAMKYQIKCIVGLFVFVFIFTTLHSQSLYSADQLISDVQQQRYDGPLRNGHYVLEEIEQGFGAKYSDADYVGVISLLSTAYMGSGNYSLADSVLSHAIDFLTVSNNNSEIHILYWIRGGLFFQLADYYKAEAYMSEALSMMDVEEVGAEYYAVILSTLSLQ